jgi:hypothetical protein
VGTDKRDLLFDAWLPELAKIPAAALQRAGKDAGAFARQFGM